MRWLAFVYGVVCYLVFLVSFVYAMGFLSNVVVPKSIDSGTSSSASMALLINLVLLGLFAVQHSGMAREGFKRWWTKWVPRPVERSTYVLIASLLLLLLFWQWRPMGTIIWSVPEGWGSLLLWILYGSGWVMVVGSTFLIDHWDLFGLRQVLTFFMDREYQPPNFQVTGPYQYVRHPIMFGFLLTFWATPTMTVGHLLFSVMTTAYILVGILLEERDLRQRFGRTYERYQQSTSMLIPWSSVEPFSKGIPPDDNKQDQKR